MKEEVKPEVTSKISLPAVVDCKSDVFHLNETKKEFSFSEPNSDLVEHTSGSMYTGTNLNLKMEDEIKPELTSDISLTAIVDSTSDILQPNEIKTELSVSELHSYVKHQDQSMGLAIKSEVPDRKCDIMSINDNTYIKLESLEYEELHIKDEVEENLQHPTEDSKIQQQIGTHTEEIVFKCSICDYSFVRKSHLQRHMKSHTGEKHFQCNICHYKSPRKRDLQQHTKTHTGEKPLKCNLCDYSCIRQNDFKQHLKSHTEDRSFHCDTCNYRCRWKSALHRHMKIHTGEKPFNCTVCDYRSTQKSRLQEHMKTHTGEKPLKCSGKTLTKKEVNLKLKEKVQTETSIGKTCVSEKKVNLKLEEKVQTEISLGKTREWINANNFDDFSVEIENDHDLQENNSNFGISTTQQRFSNPVQTKLSEDNIKFLDTSTANATSDSQSKDSKDEIIDDDDRDIDFNINDYIDDPNGSNSETSCCISIDKDVESIISEVDKIVKEPFSDKIIEKRRNEKQVVRCKYCENDTATNNFMRHLERNHKSENEVQNIFQYPKNSKERRHALVLFRNDTNFDLYVNGLTRPNRQPTKDSEENTVYYPCVYCKGLFLKDYLRRHAKSCFVQTQSINRREGKKNHLSNSQTVTACAMDPTNVISKLNVKEQVFDIMKGDEISFEAKKDLLIAHFGESYLKKHRRERIANACSNRMRGLSRLLISYRKIINNTDIAFKDILHPKNFDTVIAAVKDIVGYDHVKKTSKAPSLAMHLGTSLKSTCDELMHLILKESKGFKCKSENQSKMWLENVKLFKELVKSRWNTELASLANKDLLEKHCIKPLLLPLVNDIQKFRNLLLKLADECQQKLLQDNENEETYKLLVNCTLALLIIFNRRRIRGVQYLKVEEYESDNRSNIQDFENVLTDTEKILTTKYKRIVTSGKGSRAVVILIPEMLQKFINVLLEHREKYISEDNEYIFATPGSTIKWGKGDDAIRTLSKKIKLEHAEAISSNKLRTHIATVVQLLNLSKDEAKQVANFMGHTQKTHDEFSELPVDIYQTAKVSKLLLLMEKGSVPIEYKGKSLSEINLDPSLEYAEEDNDEDEGVGVLENQNEVIEDAKAKDKDVNTKNNDKDSYERDDEVPRKKKKVTSYIPIQKKSWSDQEMTLIKEQFKFYIERNTYPSAGEIKVFIRNTKIKRTVPVIKSKIQHLIKLKNNKK